MWVTSVLTPALSKQKHMSMAFLVPSCEVASVHAGMAVLNLLHCMLVALIRQSWRFVEQIPLLLELSHVPWLVGY